MMNLKELNAGGGKVEILVPNLKKKQNLSGRKGFHGVWTAYITLQLACV